MFIILCLSFLLYCHSYQFTKLSKSRIVLLPGYGCCYKDYHEFTINCKKYDIYVDVVNIQRYEWLNILKTLFHSNYWNYECTPQEMFDWYLQKSKKTLLNSIEKNNGKPVILCGHSAGGWLGRALLNNGFLYDSNVKSNSCIHAIVTMGTPNIPPLTKERDNTRGCLKYVDEQFPGSFLENENIRYMTLGSDVKKINMKEKNISLKDKIIKNSYLTVIGSSDEDYIFGDGVIPIECTYLKNAKSIDFHDVYHFKRKNKKYYWEESIMNIWLKELERLV